MASGFAFPPPPPPPPRKSHDSTPAGRGRGQDVYFRGQRQDRGQAADNGQQHAHASRNLPPGTFVNPNFQPIQPRGSGPATTNHQAQSNGGHGGSRFPDRSSAGHKRKLDALRGPSATLEAKDGPQAMPSMPSFGSALIGSAPMTTAAPQAKPGKSLFGSGVTNGTPEYSDSDDASEEEVADEEATYAQLGNKLVFEHEGQVITLSSEQDLARWREERRKRFPTTHRVSQKELQRIEEGAERKRLLRAAYMLRRRDWQAAIERSGLLDKLADEPTHIEPAEEPTQKQGLGLGMYDSDDEDGAPDETMAKPEQGNADDSDDGPPEAVSSKATTEVDNRPACKYFFNTGKCREGDKCAYRHEARSNQPMEQSTIKKERPRRAVLKSKKSGIHQLLLDQENAAADKLALQVIRHLGSIGFFRASD